MAKRFTKATVNWAELNKMVPPDQKGNFMAFKAKADGYLRRVLANPEQPPKINWDEYSKIVPVPGLVDKLKSSYESFKVPYPADNMTAEVDKQWQTLQPQIKEYCAQLQKEIEKATTELTRLKALPKLDEMTMETYFELFPENAVDPLKPTFWPHTQDEQLGYKSPEEIQAEKERKHH